jgi:CRP/FNR family cyclic AMP-dependent transcriptional regulator
MAPSGSRPPPNGCRAPATQGPRAAIPWDVVTEACQSLLAAPAARNRTAADRKGPDLRAVGHDGASGGTFRTVPDAVRVFEAEPGLLDGLDRRSADFLRCRAVARKLWVEAGAWVPSANDELTRGSLGLLVVDGLMVRTVTLEGRRCPELIGVGDLLRPWDELQGSVGHECSWTALERTSLAVLDERFSAAVCRWPRVMVQLLGRTVQRSRWQGFCLAIAHVRHADLRLRLLFWHLADRWGRVTPKGVHLPLRLTHEILAELACMRRPTASTAITALTRRGEVARHPDGTWLLTGSPPAARDD